MFCARIKAQLLKAIGEAYDKRKGIHLTVYNIAYKETRKSGLYLGKGKMYLSYRKISFSERLCYNF